MAKRLKTRLSAGAALATGIGMMGIATAAPAQADTDLVYTCEAPGGNEDFDISISATDTNEAKVGDTVSLAPTGTLVLSDAATRAAEDAGWEYVAGKATGVAATVSDGTENATVTTDLTFGRTAISAADSPPGLPITGTGGDVTDVEAGKYTVSAPESFSIIFSGSTEDGEQVGDPYPSECKHKSGDQVVDTITVSDDDGETPGEPEEPTEDDWFNEPSSLPLADNVFTVEGTATRAGTLSIEVLGEATDDAGEPVPGEVLETHTWKVTEGSNTKDFDLNEGAGYVRIVSQDCVDANGDDETVEGSGCNVLYTASWVDGGDNGDGEPVDDGEPEVPEVVQTDGVEATTPTEDSTLAFALGGLLLAAAGTGTVLVARRRAAARH